MKAIEIVWENASAYQYIVKGSTNGRDWEILADRRNNKSAKAERIVLDTSMRLLRIETTGLPRGRWASIREIKLTGCDGKLIQNKRLKVVGKPESIAFDDSKWRMLNVPHDWGVEGPFRDDLENNTGLLPWKGIGWYRKHFEVDAKDEGKSIFVDFDGAMANAKIWLNGQYVGEWPYGYNSFRLNLTPYIKFGQKNVMAVRLDTTKLGSRWYPGAGIYRHVWLVKTSPVHVAHWGTTITTPTVTKAEGVVNLKVKLDNDSATQADVSVQTEIFGEKSYQSAEWSTVATSEWLKQPVAGNGNGEFECKVIVKNPVLWDIDQPNLYRAVTTVKVKGRVVDQVESTFGFRTLKFTARDGFFLNGRRVNVKGVCNHHDLGPLGAAVNTRALERQLEILKEMGCNAIRTAHNPPTPELLDLCDRMGFLVQVEAFDCWKIGKRANDYQVLFDEWHKQDLEAMVKRDRNHPSVFMWSIGNEMPDQMNHEMARMLTDIVHAVDSTRPVTMGCNNGKVGLSQAAQSVDVMGYNYHTFYSVT